MNSTDIQVKNKRIVINSPNSGLYKPGIKTEIPKKKARQRTEPCPSGNRGTWVGGENVPGNYIIALNCKFLEYFFQKKLTNYSSIPAMRVPHGQKALTLLKSQGQRQGSQNKTFLFQLKQNAQSRSFQSGILQYARPRKQQIHVQKNQLLNHL